MKILEIDVSEIRNEISKQLKELEVKESEKINYFNNIIKAMKEAILDAIMTQGYISKNKISSKEIKETIEKMKNDKIIFMNSKDAEVIVKELPEFKDKIETCEVIEQGTMILISKEKMKI